VVPTYACHVTAVEAAAYMTAIKAAHVAATETATAKSATAVSSAGATTAGLRTRGKKAAGKHRACQNHHHSSSHDILLWDGRTLRHSSLPDAGVSREQTPAPRWTGDGNDGLPSPLNSRSTNPN
jgi:hypothetical protein